MEEINGKKYPLWSQFIDREKEFIGGILHDFGDSMDQRMGLKGAKTEITGIQLMANGDNSAWFEVQGKEFNCGFDVEHGGVSAGDKGYITFSGYGGHAWRIKTP